MASLFWDIVSDCLQRPTTDLDPGKGFVENGGDSLTAMAVSRALQQRGSDIPARTILGSRCLSDLTISPLFSELMDDTSLTPSNMSRRQSSAMHESNGKGCTIVGRAGEGGHLDQPMSLHETEFAGRCPSGTNQIIPGTSVGPHLHQSCVSPALESNHVGGGIRSQTRPGSPPQTVCLSDAREISGSNLEEREQPLDGDSDAGHQTEMQLALIHGSLKTPGTNIIHYSETYYSEFLPLIRMAWHRVIEAEPIFRTQFPKHLVGDCQIAFEWNEAKTGSPEQYQMLVQQALEDMHFGSYFHVLTLAEPGRRSISKVIWTVHHALVDGYSALLLSQKIRRCAAGVKIVPGPAFSALARDLTRYQNEHREEGVQFWARRQTLLQSATGGMLLPTPAELQGAPTLTCESVTILLGDKLAMILDGARASAVTFAAILHAAWALVLSRYSSSSVVVFGSVFASRDVPLAGIYETVGPMVNTLPLCIAIDSKMQVRDYLRNVFEQLVELSGFSWTPPGFGYSREFDSALAIPFDTMTDDVCYSVVPIEQPQTLQTSDIPLSVVAEHDGTIHLRFHGSRFHKKHVERVGQMLQETLLVLCRPTATVGHCWTSLLSVPDLAILRQWGNVGSGLTTKPSVTEDLVTMFEQAVDRNPEDVAVECGRDMVTYRQLNAAADRLANRLQEFVKPGDVVCTHSDRTVSWIIAVYGIMKAGAVYCSLDVSLPQDLRDSMFELAGARVFIANSVDGKTFMPRTCRNFMGVHALSSDSSEQADVVRPRREKARPTDVAYLCFTSGSTGEPKGVLCMHQSLVAFQNDSEVRLFARPGQRVAQVMSPAFDGSIHEMFSALSYGAALILPDASATDMFDHLHRSTSCILTPSIAQILEPTDFPNLEYVYLVGEPVPPTVSTLWSRHVALYNMYGPTEGTCGATIKRLFPDQPVTIGGPNPTTRIYIMDGQSRLVPPGVIGEICLAGVQVARGYIGLPIATAERFMNDPITAIGESMYKTGDRGYWDEAGEVVCLGRHDREIKLRGFRLNLDDLEIRIGRAEPAIRAVAVVLLRDQIMAVVQPDTIDTAGLASTISRVLPTHARPARILAVDKLPTTGAGKTDRRALAALLTRTRKNPSPAPLTKTQERVARTMSSVLQPDGGRTIHRDSCFDKLGGTSLAQVSLASRLTREFGVPVPLQLIIERPCLSDIADAIDRIRASPGAGVDERARAADPQGITPAEHVWLEKYELGLGSSAFNVFYSASVACARIDRGRLIDAWNRVLRRHPVLRSRFACPLGRRAVRTLSAYAPRVEEVGGVCLWAEANRPFDLGGPHALIRVLVGETDMVVAISHIIADFTALAILLRDVSSMYKGARGEEEEEEEAREERGGARRPRAPLLDKPPSYAASPAWRAEAPPCHRRWWLENLAGAPDQPALLKPLRERTSYRGTSIVSSVPLPVYRAMERYSRRSGVTMQQLALASVGLALAGEPDGSIDVVLGSPYINRPSEEDFSVVGLYLEPLPVRVTYPRREATGEGGGELAGGVTDGGGTEAYLRAVRRASQQALAHAMPWRQLLALTGTEVAYPTHPLFDVMVSFHDTAQTRALGAVLDGLQPHFVWSEGSKFKLMVEFNAFSDELLVLRLEHDTDILVPDEIHLVEVRVLRALELLVLQGEVDGVGGIVEQLSRVTNQRPSGALESTQVFGRTIRQLWEIENGRG